MDGIADLALKDRACDAGARIPTSRWPFYGTSIVQSSVDSGLEEFEFEAERDVLFTDMSVRVWYVDAQGNDVELDSRVSLTYCNTDIAVRTSGAQWRYCCSGKGPFLMGVRENKKLRLSVEYTPVGGETPPTVYAEVSLNGFQGNGCCG